MSIAYKDLTLGVDRIYTHIDVQRNFIINLCVTRIKSDLGTKLLTPDLWPVNIELATHFLEAGMVAPTKLARVLNARSAPSEPVLLIAHHDGTSTVIEGHEIYVAAVKLGVQRVLTKRVPQSIWSKYIVRDVPYTDDQLKAMSESFRPGGARPRLKH